MKIAAKILCALAHDWEVRRGDIGESKTRRHWMRVRQCRRCLAIHDGDDWALKTAKLKFQAEQRLAFPWWKEALDLKNGDGLAEARTQYRKKAMTAHPDRGGSLAAMQRLNDAYAEAKRALQ